MGVLFFAKVPNQDLLYLQVWKAIIEQTYPKIYSVSTDSVLTALVPLNKNPKIHTV